MSGKEIPPVPYLNTEFLKGQDARTLRILSEYLEPLARLNKYRIRDTIVFFGSARSVAPEVSEPELEQVRKQLEQAPSPELDAELERIKAFLVIA